ncbi:hypothetical protein [Cyclobacterium lianum]|uniref:hypothetical protein n=1 Tax=Cyclobacterium lianum TaxID=388280 RepID=UPI000932DC5F|nr:hypothetical protein [Cyclobacterium lianum]
MAHNRKAYLSKIGSVRLTTFATASAIRFSMSPFHLLVPEVITLCATATLLSDRQGMLRLEKTGRDANPNVPAEIEPVNFRLLMAGFFLMLNREIMVDA